MATLRCSAPRGDHCARVISFASASLLRCAPRTSPGPLHPKNYPHVKAFVQSLPPETFVYGVCLGLQLLVESEGGLVESYTPPLHGKKSKLKSKLAVNGLSVARYHSLKCVPGDDFEILALSEDDGLPMWLRHKSKNWMGVQFHPESFLTSDAAVHLQQVKLWMCR